MTFDPRRAEPGQEFGYTATEERTVKADDEAPEGWTPSGIDPETGDRTFVREGVQKTMKADDSGVVHPKSIEEVAVLDSFALPVARSAIAEAKKSEAPKKEG